MSIRIYGNRAIKTLPGKATRPTAARVREAVFNIWQGRVREAAWLDVCAGSGAMGAEALCRGAQGVVGIERSGAACRIIRENWQKVAKPQQSFEVIKGDVRHQLRRLTQTFDLIYFDPPYADGLYEVVLPLLAERLSLTGEIAAEYRGNHWQPDALPKTLEIVREKRYGSTELVFLQRV